MKPAIKKNLFMAANLFSQVMFMNDLKYMKRKTVQLEVVEIALKRKALLLWMLLERKDTHFVKPLFPGLYR